MSFQSPPQCAATRANAQGAAQGARAALFRTRRPGKRAPRAREGAPLSSRCLPRGRPAAERGRKSGASRAQYSRGVHTGSNAAVKQARAACRSGARKLLTRARARRWEEAQSQASVCDAGPEPQRTRACKSCLLPIGTLFQMCFPRAAQNKFAGVQDWVQCLRCAPSRLVSFLKKTLHNVTKQVSLRKFAGAGGLSVSPSARSPSAWLLHRSQAFSGHASCTGGPPQL